MLFLLPVLLGDVDLLMVLPVVQNYDTHGAGADISGSSNGKTEALAACESKGFIGGTDIVGLSRSLSITHGQKKTGCFEQTRFDRH